MSEPPRQEWPREIWMAERDEYDQGVVSAVLSEHATVARWEGDGERDRDFHRYIDADIHDSAERYFLSMLLNARSALEEAHDALRSNASDRERNNARNRIEEAFPKLAEQAPT